MEPGAVRCPGFLLHKKSPNCKSNSSLFTDSSHVRREAKVNKNRATLQSAARFFVFRQPRVSGALVFGYQILYVFFGHFFWPGESLNGPFG